MRPLIAGNWKMNGLGGTSGSLATALRDGAAHPGCELLVFPPATVLGAVAAILSGSAVAVGGQDCHPEPWGAHTGDISAPMLRDAGAAWVILGHSERRHDHGETSALVRGKTDAAIAAGLIPIVCVGETEAERRAGRERDTVVGQLRGSLPPDFKGVIAYEPVWAIGSGRTPTSAEVVAMHGFIRGELRLLFGDAGAAMRILYGGSVKPDNAAGFLGLPEVGGALVGGASLSARDFLAIAAAAGALSKPAATG